MIFYIKRGPVYNPNNNKKKHLIFISFQPALGVFGLLFPGLTQLHFVHYKQLLQDNDTFFLTVP